AIYMLAKSGGVTSVRFKAPFVLVNGHLVLFLKYSTRGRSPWAFTFAPEEQRTLATAGGRGVIGLICGSDGVAAVDLDSYSSIAAPRNSAIHIACYRDHGGYYELSGPDGTLKIKIAPSRWCRLLETER